MCLPLIGFGTWRLKGEECEIGVRRAIETGYTLIDSASIYKNEENIGSKLFITSKCSPYENRNADEVYSACIKSLEKLGIDEYLLHWPGSKGVDLQSHKLRTIRAEAWSAMCRLKEEGKVRMIGVSNYNVSHLQQLFEDVPQLPKPEVNQVECHLLYPQTELHAFCAAHSIQVQGYATLGGGEPVLLEHPLVAEVAAKHRTTPAGVLMGWSLFRGVGVLPRSSNPQRVESNLRDAQGLTVDGEGRWQLDEVDVQQLESLVEQMGVRKFCWDPDTVA